MAENSKNTPDYEYTKVDCTITLNFDARNAVAGDLPLANRWESATFAPGADAGTMPGSGRTPRAHRAVRYAPELTIVVDADTADEILRRQGKRAIKSVTIVRQRPNDAPITTVYEKWMAQYGDLELGDDPAQVEVTGMLLGWTPDKQRKISITT